MKIGSYEFDEYLQVVKSFHGHLAPGMIIGGVMVDLSQRQLAPGVLYDAISETRNCLPDAIQLLTPCTIGNGWLKVVNLGRFALTLFDKYGGEGVRVFLDPARVRDFPEIETWYLKLQPKPEQDKDLLLRQIREAGARILTWQRVTLKPPFFGRKDRGRMTVCPLCREAYPARDGGICRACQGEAPYQDPDSLETPLPTCVPSLSPVPLSEAPGRRLLHDMTQIIPGQSKGPVFKKDQVITVGDLCRLQQMGRQQLYVAEENPVGPEWVHENEAALAFAQAMAGEGVVCDTFPREGKVNLLAARHGLFTVNQERLEAFNLVPGVMCACRHGHTAVSEGRLLAGTRAIPLFLPRSDFHQALAILADGPLFQVLPLKPARVGVLVTGTEVFLGLVEDRFVPIIQNKVEKFGCEVAGSLIVPDDRRAISKGTRELLDAGVDLLVTTAGLSVDPDDVTRQGLLDAGATDMLYGAPILPGAMTLLARIGAVRVIGVPACALYFKRTSFDLILPRLLAGLEVGRRDLASLGHGALCLECQTCSFPKCPFGR